METFKVDSWTEHLRQHERVTHADRELQESVDRFQIDGAPVRTSFSHSASFVSIICDRRFIAKEAFEIAAGN